MARYNLKVAFGHITDAEELNLSVCYRHTPDTQRFEMNGKNGSTETIVKRPRQYNTMKKCCVYRTSSPSMNFNNQPDSVPVHLNLDFICLKFENSGNAKK